MASGVGDLLRRLRDAGPTSRADLARASGLSSAGVTKITGPLLEKGLVREQRVEDVSAVGRPPVTLALRPNAKYVFGIHMGAERVHIGISNLLLSMSHFSKLTYRLDEPVSEVLARTVEHTRQVIKTSGLTGDQILGVGVGVPGSVDPAQRVNTHSILTDWHNVAFADVFEDALGLPTIVEHNATAIAMAEATYGEGRSADSILYLLLGKGIGAGFAQTGPFGRRGPVEIGHVVVAPGGPACRCGGQGCLERFFSEEPLRTLAGDRVVSREDLVAAAMGSPAWPPVYQHLLQALSTTVTLLAPQQIVLGGDLNTVPEDFLTALRADLLPRVMPQQRQKLKIARTSLPEPTGAHGAACIALEQFFYAAGPAATARTAGQVARA